MRIVGGKQQPVDSDPFDHRAQVAGMLRFLDRLRGKPEALTHGLRWRPPHVRNLIPEALPVLVHPPADGGYPAEAALDEDKLQTREAFGDALDDQARSEEHTSELQSLRHLVCRLLLEKK